LTDWRIVPDYQTAVQPAEARSTPASPPCRSPLSSAAARAPGPAYYNPRARALLDKRSFHFNGVKKWTPA
jgi:hypothetical protein